MTGLWYSRQENSIIPYTSFILLTAKQPLHWVTPLNTNKKLSSDHQPPPHPSLPQFNNTFFFTPPPLHSHTYACTHKNTQTYTHTYAHTHTQPCLSSHPPDWSINIFPSSPRPCPSPLPRYYGGPTTHPDTQCNYRALVWVDYLFGVFSPLKPPSIHKYHCSPFPTPTQNKTAVLKAHSQPAPRQGKGRLKGRSLKVVLRQCNLIARNLFRYNQIHLSGPSLHSFEIPHLLSSSLGNWG